MDYPKLVAFLIEVNKAQQVQLNGQRVVGSKRYQAIEEMNKRLSAAERN